MPNYSNLPRTIHYTNYSYHGIPLILTYKHVGYILDNGEDMGIDSWDKYERFMLDNYDEDTLIAELIQFMIEDKIVEWIYGIGENSPTSQLKYVNN